MLSTKPILILVLSLHIYGFLDEQKFKEMLGYDIVQTTTYLDILVFTFVCSFVSFISILLVWFTKLMLIDISKRKK
jgi:hypothetical protein